MVLRLLFVLLVALNIAVGAWLVLGQDEGYARSVTDPGVPMLHLLSEQPPPAVPEAPAAAPSPAPAQSAAVAAVSPPPAAAASVPAPQHAPPPVPSGPLRTNTYTCTAIGPFATPQDLRNARAALSPLVAKTRSRQEQTTQTRGWWVYLPASASRTQALALASRLEAAHVGEYFVVGSGDQSNTISLGLFKDPANARKRREEVVAAGFPAQMAERTETVPEYWLDVAANDARFDWHGRVRAEGVGSHSTSCF